MSGTKNRSCDVHLSSQSEVFEWIVCLFRILLLRDEEPTDLR